MALGFPHPDYLLRILTSSQLAEWEAYFNIEPFGGRRQEEIFGLLCATIGNSGWSQKKDKTPFTPDDFFPDRIKKIEEFIDIQENGPVKQDTDTMRHILMSMATKPKDKKDSLIPKKEKKVRGPERFK